MKIVTCVVASGEVVRSVFFATDELLWVEQLTVCSGPHLINDGGLKVKEHGAGDVLSSPRFTEESVEGIVSAAHSFVTWHLAIRLQTKRSPKI